MDCVTRFYSLVLMAVLIWVPLTAGAAPVPADSAITYTIALQEDGTAVWHVEYRTLLESDDDIECFQDGGHIQKQ